MSEETPKTRVLFTLTDLAAGGAQKITLLLLENLPRDRFDLHLAIGQATGKFAGRVPKDVGLHELGAARARDMRKPLAALVARLQPDVVFSTLFHVNQMLLLMRRKLPRGTRVVVREASIPGTFIQTLPRPWLVSFLFRWLYRKAERVICQCDDMATHLHERFGVPRDRMLTIYNPLDLDALRARAQEARNPFTAQGLGPHVVGVGRLIAGKGFDRLVDAMPALVDTYPEAHVWVLGDDGGEADALRARAEALGVASRLHLMGFQENPAGWLRFADLYVQTSLSEGMPNALLEAIALGCPVVALPCPGGTREVLEHTGHAERQVEALQWDREWFRSSSESVPARLDAFSLDRALSAYAEVLSGER